MPEVSRLSIAAANQFVGQEPRKRGRPRKKPMLTVLKEIDPREIIRLQKEIVRLIESGRCSNLSQAAKEVGISPAMAHAWKRLSKDFDNALSLAREVVADGLEADLLGSDATTAKYNMLKGLRPEYRETYNVNLRNPRLEADLIELKKLTEAVLLAMTPPPAPEPIPTEPPKPDEGKNVP